MEFNPLVDCIKIVTYFSFRFSFHALLQIVISPMGHYLFIGTQLVIVLATQKPENTKKSLVLNLQGFLHRKANKVIMTMVTVLGTPAKSTSPSPTMMLPTLCQLLPEPHASNLTPQLHETHIFSSPVPLQRDISMAVSTTTDAPNACDDNDN